MHSSIKRMRPDDFHKPFFSAGDVLAILTPATSRRPLLRQGEFLMSNRTLTGIALIVLLSTLALSFGQTRNPPPSPIITTDQRVTTATLAGRLLDNVGNPISGALVNCAGPEGTTSYVTGPDGAYRFNLSRTATTQSSQTSPATLPSQAGFDVI